MSGSTGAYRKKNPRHIEPYHIVQYTTPLIYPNNKNVTLRINIKGGGRYGRIRNLPKSSVTIGSYL